MKYAENFTTLQKLMPRMNEAIAERDHEKVHALAVWAEQLMINILNEAQDKKPKKGTETPKKGMIYAHVGYR